MEGPLPIHCEKRVSICRLLGLPSHPCLAFVSRFLSFPLISHWAVTLLRKDTPSLNYIIQSSYLHWCPSFVWNVPSILLSRAASCCCVSAAIMQSWRVQDLPYWWDEVLCCVAWWKKAKMVSMNGSTPPSRCANAIMASQYDRLGRSDIFSIYIWRTENSTKGDS